MRDPAGRITFEGNWVVRRLNSPAGSDHFLRSSLAARWVARGDLVPYEWLDEATLRTPKLPFVTFPGEWATPQFHAAAELTLRLQIEAVAEGWDLKDASAWNVVFDGLRPVFVDLLSFERLQCKLWRAAGQFARHFILPLLLDKMQLMEPCQCMQLWRDGVPADVARRMLGSRRFLTRYWPLMAGAKSQSTASTMPVVESANVNMADVRRFRAGLQQSLQWMVAGVAPSSKRVRGTVWGEYEQEREHYAEPALEYKRKTIAAWLEAIRPNWVLDVGCNAGEFSEIAVSTGARAICWDADPEAIAKLCRRYADQTHYHPILGPVDDAPGGRGWMGGEFPALMTRLHQQVDVVMMLAVIHHLAIACSVRLIDIFRFAKLASSDYILVEMLPDTDERVAQLCQQYGRDAAEFTLAKQYDAIREAGLHVLKSGSFGGTGARELALLQV